MPPHPTITIIGAGIGGLAAAIALRQAGFACAVYEQAPRIEAVGAGLTLWPNAFKALRHLGLADTVAAAGQRIQHSAILAPSGQPLSQLEMSRVEARTGEPVVAVHRADLHAILMGALPPDTVHAGKRLLRWEQDETGIRSIFTDQTSVRSELLVGADGIHSTVRAFVAPAARLRYAGAPAWRGTASLDGYTGSLTSETWGRGRRFGVVPIGRGRIYWFATANGPAGQQYTPEEHRARLLDLFGGWHIPIRALIEATPPEALLYNDLIDIPPFHPWHAGRVVLLGDAAHPTTPNLGQGACQALESAVVLAGALVESPRQEDALQRYEAERWPRAAMITRLSWQIGRAAQVAWPPLAALRNGLVALTPAAVMERQFIQITEWQM